MFPFREVFLILTSPFFFMRDVGDYPYSGVSRGLSIVCCFRHCFQIEQEDPSLFPFGSHTLSCGFLSEIPAVLKVFEGRYADFLFALDHMLDS